VFPAAGDRHLNQHGRQQQSETGEQNKWFFRVFISVTSVMVAPRVKEKTLTHGMVADAVNKGLENFDLWSDSRARRVGPSH
jgi:hypothetical protein